MAIVWILRRVLCGVGTIFFWLVGLAREVDFIGPGSGAVPETAALQSFKRAGDQPKQVAVRRGGLCAVFQVGGDSKTIRTHGLYIPIEPDTLRGDSELEEKLRHVDRVHLCRNVAGTEEGCEHFQEYGMVKMFNPECFTTAHCRCWQSDLELDEYNPPSGTCVTRLVGKLKGAPLNQKLKTQSNAWQDLFAGTVRTG